MDSVALMVAKVIKKKKETLILKGLEEDKCLQLLNIHAFADVENQDDHKKLRSITRELVKKLFGPPLAAKVMGGVLNSSLDERHWTNVLNSDLGHNDIFPILKLSYIFLPKYLQNCFAFCSIFTQDHVFDKDDLVRMWIAVGFIQPSCIRGEAVEDIGRMYFDVLVKKSLFDKDGTKYYKMHDLLHELAQSISAQECFRVVGDENLLLGLPKTIRHLSVQTSNVEVLKNLGGFKNLRMLMLTYYKYDQDFVDVLAEIFKVTRSIRLLVIFDSCLKIVPETIGYLTHLRYLRLNFRFDILLPRSISNLYHLQFLICKDYTSHLPDDFFPRDMNNLSNLRYLSFPNWLKFRLFSFPGIGKLKFLQELKVFDVKNENGYRIGELKPMNDLRILGIKGLENIEDAEEACSAKLCDKKNLRDLSLEWGDIQDRMGQAITRNFVDSDLDERVLDNLQPHNYLKNLKMVNYMGVKSAIWMSKAHLINNLECIDLYICLEWRNLPPFGQLPFLKSLRLLYMPKAKRFDNKFHGNDMRCCFPSLEKLYIENLEALEDWFDAGVDCLFPCLTELFLKGCPNLQELPYLPPKLEILEIHKIGWKTLNCCGISKSIPLKTLEVRRCPNITNIFLASEIGGVAALRYVKIEDCPNLISFGGTQEVETTGTCSNLKLNDLSISDPSVLQMEPLVSVTSIKSLTSLTSLQIEIYDVP